MISGQQLRATGIAFGLTIQTAQAACDPPSDTLMRCTLDQGRKLLQVCLTDRAVDYSFGAPNAEPELHLTRDVTDVGYAPWPGVGRTIFESITFRNDTYSYEIFTSIDRDPNSATDEIDVTISGGVMVYEAQSNIAELTCDPDSVIAGIDLLFSAKIQAGQCFDRAERHWKSDCN